MRTIVIIQARLGSTRLPRKILADLGGHPLLWHVLNRATKIPGTDGTVLAMPVEYEPGIVSDVAAEFNVPIVRPHTDEADVLGRYLIAANLARADVVIRITADCPFIDPIVSGQVLAAFLESGVEYAHNLAPESGYPDGLDTQVFSRYVLYRANEEATDQHDREHVCPWMARNCLRLCVQNDSRSEAHRKWSIDEAYDLIRARMVYENLKPDDLSWQVTKEAENVSIPAIC